MHQIEYRKKLREELKTQFGIDFKTKTVKIGDTVMLEIATHNHSQFFDWEIYFDGEILDAERKLRDTLELFSNTLYESTFVKVKNEINQIKTACEFYGQNCLERATYPNQYSGKCTKEELTILASFLYTERTSILKRCPLCQIYR